MTARTFTISVAQRIAAPAEAVYGVFADYREAHPRILPPSFFVGLKVEQGGYGSGTVILVEGRFAGRTRVIRGIVTEPEPGRLLVESYPAERMVTSFRVDPEPAGASSLVTISTEMPRRAGPVGWIEERIVRRLLSRVFAEELDLVAAYLARAEAPVPLSSTTSTRLRQHVNAPREAVYRALLDAHAVASWMVPDDMTSQVHVFEAREGGPFRISLTYDEPAGAGKTTAHTDTYHGHFVKLVPNEQVVQVMEFETTDPAMRGEMTVTFLLRDADAGTEVLATHENVPPGIAPEDNETGWRMSLEKLAKLVEAGQRP